MPTLCFLSSYFLALLLLSLLNTSQTFFQTATNITPSKDRIQGIYCIVFLTHPTSEWHTGHTSSLYSHLHKTPKFTIGSSLSPTYFVNILAFLWSCNGLGSMCFISIYHVPNVLLLWNVVVVVLGCPLYSFSNHLLLMIDSIPLTTKMVMLSRSRQSLCLMSLKYYVIDLEVIVWHK